MRSPRSKSKLLISASRETIKVKTLYGESKQALLGDNLDSEEFLKHNIFFTCHLEKTGVEAKLEKATELAASIANSGIPEEAPPCSCKGKGRSQGQASRRRQSCKGRTGDGEGQSDRPSRHRS